MLKFNLGHLLMNQIKVIFALLLLSSCVEVNFKNPMPPKGETLDKIPTEIITYFMSLKKDSLGNSKLNLDNINGDFDLNDPLPEEVILKKWKGNYFLNQKEENLWQIYMVKPAANNSFEVYQLDGSNQHTVDKLKSITNVEEVFSDNGDLNQIIIDPSFKEFKKIVKSGAFEQIDLLEN